MSRCPLERGLSQDGPLFFLERQLAAESVTENEIKEQSYRAKQEGEQQARDEG